MGRKRQWQGDEWNREKGKGKREGIGGTAVWGGRQPHHTSPFSLQGALQLRRDFRVIQELLEEEQWDLSLELRQTLLLLSIFQQLDGALLCLLQQPMPKARVQRRSPCCCESLPFPTSMLSSPLPTLCASSPILITDLASVYIPAPLMPLTSHLASIPALLGVYNEIQTTELPSSSLNSLESLEPPLRPGAPPAQTAQLLSTLWGGRPTPEAYLVGNQQAWLALRQHQRPRWHLPFLSCLGISPES